MKKVYVIVLALIICGCKPQRPQEILSPSKMEDILVDYHLAQGMTETANKSKEKLRYEYIQAVFHKHRITEATFDSSMIYYSINAEHFAEIYNNVTRRIEAQATLVGVDAQATKNLYSNLSDQGDTANIWTDRTHQTLKRELMSNMYKFNMHADSTFKKGDSFLWRFDAQFKTEGNINEAIAIFLVRYSNDSVASKHEFIRDNGLVELRAPSHNVDTLNIKNISGFLYMPLPTKKQETQFATLFIEEMSLIRFHKKKIEIQQSDSLENDTIEKDSLFKVETDSDTVKHIRLTPAQLRENQTHEQKVNIVKEKPIKLQRAPIRRTK